MAAGKDMRRPDLVVPFQEPPPRSDDSRGSTDLAAIVNSVLPMASLVMRNRIVGWAAVISSILSWLGQSGADTGREMATPAYFPVLMSVVSLVVTYLPLLLPSPGQLQKGSGSGTEVPLSDPLQ